MAKQNINVGSSANDRSGDSLRSAFQKINSNFTELYTALGLNADTNLNIGAFEFTGSTMSTTDSSAITIDQATTVSSNLTVGGDILPSVANGGDLGSAAKPWKSLYVSGSTIYIGGNALSINDEGELTYNNNRVAHEAGEFMTLDNLSDLNVNSPNAGDTIAWSGSQYVNVPLIQDRLADDGDEVVLVGGANPYVTFPAITGGDQLVIQGGEVTASSGNLALTGQSTVTVISNAAGVGGGSNYFTFAANGTLMFPDGSLALTDSVLNNGLDADIKGSVFGDDSSVIVNAIDRTLHSVSVNTLQLNFNISGDNIVAPTGGYVTIGTGDGAGGVNNVAIFDAGGIRFDQNVVMGNASEVRHDTTNNWLDLNLAGGNVGLASQTGVVGIYADYAGGPYTWLFKDNGSIQFPDMSLQTTAFTGTADIARNIESENDVSIRVNLSDSTQRIWRFGEDGELTFPDGTTTVGKTITVPAEENFTITLQHDSMVGPGPEPFSFVASWDRIRLPTGNGTIIAGSGASDNEWNLDVVNKNLSFPNNDLIRYNGSVAGEGADYGLNLYTYTKPVRITSGQTKSWIFGTDGKLTVPGIIELSNGAQIFNTAGVDDSITIGATGTPGTITFNGSGFFNDDTFFHKAIQEKFSSLQDATGVVTHNCTNGHIFYHTSPDANWTVNLTNFSLITNYATAITIIISQGGTGYYPNALQIGGAAQTINWQGNATPTPSSNRVDVVTFSIINISGTYTVLGQLTGF